VPRYDLFCQLHDVVETFATVETVRSGTLCCPYCGLEAPQVFSPRSFPQARIDSAGEDSTDPRRIADGSAGYNLGLRGIDTVVGTRPDGTPMLEYRPLTNHEVSSNRARSEAAKRQGMTPMERGSYRPLGSR
jgi:hypothetical protein